MSKEITLNEEAWKKIQSGVNKLADVVAVTLGPGGSNVILERSGGGQYVTKDGVTLAREVVLEDLLENIGAMIIKEAANKTMEKAGDGTSTSTILARALFNGGVKNVTSGANRMDIKKGIEIGVQEVVAQLKALSQPVEDGDLLKVATISANGDDVIGKLINEAVGKVGKDGLITVEDTHGIESYVKKVEGTRFDRGYLSPYFVTNPQKMEVEFHNCEVLIYDGIIEKFREQLATILEKRKQRGFDLPLLIIAEDVMGEALATLALNHVKGNLAVCAVQLPDFGDTRKENMKDIATLTGATPITKELGITLQTANLNVLGSAEKIRVTQWNTSIINGRGDKDALDGRINMIKEQMTDANPQALVALKDRYVRLVNGMAVIYVGGTTDVEIKEKKDRIDDSLQATRAALEEGVVVGGGMAYIRALSNVIHKPQVNADTRTGVELLYDCLSIPLKTLAENAGVSGDVAYMKVVENDSPTWGFNARTLVYEDLIAAGVIDPTKVVRLALENAASVAGMLLSTKAVVSNVKHSDK